MASESPLATLEVEIHYDLSIKLPFKYLSTASSSSLSGLSSVIMSPYSFRAGVVLTSHVMPAL
jgi:hypothetical protein